MDLRTGRRWVFWISGVLLFALIGDAVYAGVSGGAALYEARSSLLSAVDELRDGEADLASEGFVSAEEDIASARASFGHPGWKVVERLPYIGRDASSATQLAHAAAGIPAGGREAVSVLERLGNGGDLGSGLLVKGRLRLDRLEGVTSQISSLYEEVLEARSILEGIPRPNLGILRDAVAQARDRLRGAEEALRKGQAIAGAADPLFGKRRTKRYLLAFQAPSEARGSGGLFGLFATLEIKNGAIEISAISKPPKPLLASAAPEITPVNAPDWFEDKYASEGALWNSSEVNLSPHFPTVAEALLDMFRQVRDVKLDGVLALDPHALAYFLEGTGPIDIPGLGPVDAENAERVLMYDAYVKLSPEEQDVALGMLVDAFFTRLRQGDVSGPVFLSSVGSAAAEGRLKFYVRDGSAADALTVAGAAGDFTTAGSMQQLVWHNSDSVSKVDWFLHRTVETIVRLQEDGSAQVETNVLLENKAPKRPASLLLGGRAEGYRPGENRMRFDFLMPRGSRLTSFKDGETEIEPEVGSEAGYPSAWTRLIMEPKSQRLLSFTYEIADAFAANTFGFTLYPHSAVRPDGYLLTIYAPPDSSVRRSGMFDEPAEFVQMTGRLREPVTLEVQLTD